ncbi:RING-H2 finger protein ATL79-like [Gossypium arboreum]|uniref:RING-type E3 ubiquitin transferase n=1 Tax=Gossypium arboreum TaxID=29729 RepID=A0ABR0P390_GOSAR|nr:RING-H2 finger protein ATL79-like [Gossypium arboreum]KAK5812049.1 hypothetical protein PVK06_027444 [Gossypium arboreum]
MRPPPAVHMSPPLSSGEPQMSSTSTSTCRWRPYSNSNGLEANAAIGLVILFCALICSLALNAAICCFLRGGGHSRNNQLSLTQQQLEQRKPVPETAAARMVEASTLVYSTGMKLIGAEPECATCLSGFVEGERIQVLGKCKHGFHVQCIQQWLSFHFSCPTCRSTCLSPSPSSEETFDQCVDNISQQVAPQGRA